MFIKNVSLIKSICPHGFCQAQLSEAFFAWTGRAVLFVFGENLHARHSSVFVKQRVF